MWQKIPFVHFSKISLCFPNPDEELLKGRNVGTLNIQSTPQCLGCSFYHILFWSTFLLTRAQNGVLSASVWPFSVWQKLSCITTCNFWQHVLKLIQFLLYYPQFSSYYSKNLLHYEENCLKLVLETLYQMFFGPNWWEKRIMTGNRLSHRKKPKCELRPEVNVYFSHRNLKWV